MGIDVSGLDINDTDALVDLWNDNYEVTAKPAGMTMAKRNYYKRLNNALLELRSADVRIIADENDEGDLEKVNSISKPTMSTSVPLPTSRLCRWAPTTSAATSLKSWCPPAAPPSESA